MPDSPETESREVKADIPPTGTIFIFFSIAIFIILTPGSLMHGVPASLIIAADFPFAMFSIYSFILYSDEWL